MKKMLAVVSLVLSMPLVAEGVEFQTPGSVGIGGAGVARNNGALTSYWNPAGAAFSKSTLAVNAGAGAGIQASDGLTENIDLLSTIDFNNVTKFDTASAGAKEVGDVVKTHSILNDINTRQGNIAINVIAPVSFSIKNISFGIYAGMEGYVMPVADMINILPNTQVAGVPLTVKDLANAVGSSNTASGYFSATDLVKLTQAIATADGTITDPTQLAYAIDTQLKDSGIDPATALTTITDKTLPILTAGSNKTLDKNTTSVMTKAFQYIEVPVSYGQPFDIGKKGKLGLGITGKIIKGTVYQNQVKLLNRSDNNVDAKDIINDITENQKSSSAIGIDIGALYKYENWLNIGLVAKNINSPKFEGPTYYEPITSIPHSDTSVELKPQIRTGVAVEPVGWMTLAADLDLTENDTVSSGSIKSRNFGGGFEVKPASWLKVRGGAYKNLAMSNGSVLTAGFKLFLLDVDGAMATNTFTIDGNEVPREVKVNASMSFSF